MKIYKIMFINMAVMGSLMAISSSSWFGMWMGLEISTLSVIPVLNSHKNMFSSESSLKYFITQTLASLILLMSMILMLLTKEFISPQMNFLFAMVMNSSLMMKLGAAPFHFWFPEVMEGLKWPECLMLLTAQKIAPMFLIANNQVYPKFMMSIAMMSLMISTISGMNQVSIRKIMAFSSINHIAWLLIAVLISHNISIIYFSIYSILNMNIILMLNHNKIYFMNQMNNIMNQNKLFKFTFMMNFMSLGGLPPFIGFMPKWLVINWAILNNLFLMALAMIILTLIMLFIYTRMMLMTIIMNYMEPKNIQFKTSNNLIIFITTMTTIGLATCTTLFNFL